ncbi:MAG: hypothetical protein DMH00_02395 [Acidobacteria bacterium]|nr:MAG: hypothetical protein DMH00_02395 [Acidobacteriota bacterium]
MRAPRAAQLGLVAPEAPLESSAVVLFLLVACLGARTRERNRDWKDDYTLFRSAVKVCPRSAKVRYNLANAYRRRGDLARAADNYRRCLALYDDFEPARRNLAVTLTDLGQGGEAVALLQSALLKAPGSASLHNNLGNAYRALGRIEEAEASYRRAASLDPRSPDPHNNLAALYQARGEMERAEAELLEALRLSPPSLRILSSLGDLYLQRREMGKALEAFEEAVHIDGASPVARRGLGEALLGLGRRGQAESELHRSLELDPSQWEAPALLGYLRQQQGEGEQAERYYLMSLAARPDQPELHQNLGVIYAGRPGGKAMALEHFRRCLELRPPKPTASRVQRMIEDLESGKLEGH